MPHSNNFKTKAHDWQMTSRIRTVSKMSQQMEQDGGFSPSLERYVNNRAKMETTKLKSGQTRNYFAIRNLFTGVKGINVDRNQDNHGFQR